MDYSPRDKPGRLERLESDFRVYREQMAARLGEMDARHLQLNARVDSAVDALERRVDSFADQLRALQRSDGFARYSIATAVICFLIMVRLAV